MSEFHRLSYRLWRSSRKFQPDMRGLLRGQYPEFIFRAPSGPLTDEIPVFVFHSVAPKPFEQQLRYLKDNGYQTPPNADALLAHLQGRQPLPPNSVVLTFDDGRASLYRVAFPLLRAHGFSAVAFIVPAFVGLENFCGWNELREMADAGVVDIQSHTLCHRSAPRWPLIVRCLNGTNQLPDDARACLSMEADYRRSRELLEAELGRPVRHLCYPDYDGTAASVAASQAAGYLSNFWGVIVGRRANRPGSDPYYIVRVPEIYLQCLPGRGRRSLARVLAAQTRQYGPWLSQWICDPAGQGAEQLRAGA